MKVFVKAELIESADRNDNCVIGIKSRVNNVTKVTCSTYEITKEKPDTECILRMLNHEYKNMIKETSSYADREYITKIFSKVEQIIKLHQ